MSFFLPVLAIFFGSFLLFGIQPMLGRTLLPPFGGTAAVWTVCLAAYQLLLLVGYGYAHMIAQRGARTQRRLHLALLAAAVLWSFGFAALRLALRDRLGDFPAPSLEVLFCVLVFVGLPYVLLSANSTLIQAWLVQGEVSGSGFKGSAVEGSAQPVSADAHRGRGVYRLYAVSNFGSLLGLLVYPFALEPFVSLNVQWYGFAACLLLYTLLLAAVARSTLRKVGEVQGSTVQGSRLTLDDSLPTADCPLPTADCPLPTAHCPLPTAHCPLPTADCPLPTAHCPLPTADCPLPTADCPLPAALARPWLWFALPALSTFLLNAVTAHLSTDVTPVPMMWALLLTAFLLSYIIGFSAVGEKGFGAWTTMSALTLLGAASVSGMKGGPAFLSNLIFGAATVLICCTFLHSWLYLIRPDAQHLTRFYLGIAAGGATGGVCASLVAPLLLPFVWEFPLSLVVTAGVCAWMIIKRAPTEITVLNRFLLAAAAGTLLFVSNQVTRENRNCVLRMRNFYGCLRVVKDVQPSSVGDRLQVYRLFHGETMHGFQVLEESHRKEPTAYFVPQAGGLSFTQHPKYGNNTPMRVAVVGQGIGTLACYARAHDVFRFYEINPQVIRVASDTNFFSFVTDAAAPVQMVLGDARKRLETERKETQQKYDVLVVDAYSGDSIPFHLATREAFELYLDRLNEDGILALHISNWHVDLTPLCKAVASTFRLHISSAIALPDGLSTGSYWVFLTRPPLLLENPSRRKIDWRGVENMELPSDERGSLLSLIRFGYAPPIRELMVDPNSLNLL